MKIYSTLPLLALVVAVSGFAPNSNAAPETWKIDPPHSSVGFNIRHFISKVPGWFTTFSGTIVFDPSNPSASSAEATVQAASVSTNNAKRDGHLKTQDFFLVDKFPTLTFKSTAWVKTGADTYDITGDLTIKDVTKPITLAAKFIGTAPGPKGATVSAWEATAKVDRRDFGLNYGAGVLGNDVEVVVNIEAVKQ